jgi:excisionase family DNA binding protein
MLDVSIFDKIYTREQTPFVLDFVRGDDEVYFRLRFDGVTVFIRPERLAEMHLAIVDALAQIQPAPETHGELVAVAPPCEEVDELGSSAMEQMNPEGSTITVDEAHGIIGTTKISRGAFYAAINRNEVPHLRLGGRILIPRHAFLRWLSVDDVRPAA